MPLSLPPGLYERLVTGRLDEILSALDVTRLHVERGALDPEDAHRVLARHVAATLDTVLRALPGEPPERLARQMDLVNALLDEVKRRLGTAKWVDLQAIEPGGDGAASGLRFPMDCPGGLNRPPTTIVACSIAMKSPAHKALPKSAPSAEQGLAQPEKLAHGADAPSAASSRSCLPAGS